MEKTTDLDNMKQMEEEYEKSAFPPDDTGTTFSSTSMYWRPIIADEKRADYHE